tara:strand:- start:4706 stop:4828 length:123 start_codon:yes stop_codon:yes gene_type:complete
MGYYEKFGLGWQRGKISGYYAGEASPIESGNHLSFGIRFI